MHDFNWLIKKTSLGGMLQAETSRKNALFLCTVSGLLSV